MYTELQSKEVIVRKTHSCEWCAEQIEEQEKAHYRVYIFDGEFQAGWMHPECFDAMQEAGLDDRIGDTGEFTPGDHKRGSSEIE